MGANSPQTATVVHTNPTVMEDVGSWDEAAEAVDGIVVVEEVEVVQARDSIQYLPPITSENIETTTLAFLKWWLGYVQRC